MLAFTSQDDQCSRAACSMGGGWVDRCGWAVAGCGWFGAGSVAVLWLGCGWAVAELWLGLWLVCGWAVGGCGCSVAWLWLLCAGRWLVCGWSVADLWLGCGRLWLLCAWSVAALCLVYGWAVAGMWLFCGWRVAGLWLGLGCGWAVAGLWLVCGWAVIGLWLGCGRSVAGLWLASGGAVAGPVGGGLCLGPAPGQPLDLASFRKTLDSCTRNGHFRAGPPKPIVSSTRKAHFQNSILTHPVDDPSPAGPTAPTEIDRPNLRAHLCGRMRFFLRAPKKTQPQTELLNRTLLRWIQAFVEIRAKPGQAGPGRAEPGWSGTPGRAGSRPAARFGKLQKNT